MSSWRRAVAVGAAIAGAALLLGTPAANADDETAPAGSSPMTAQLCASRLVPCAVQITDTLQEGSAPTVHVTGTPGSAAAVQLFRLDVVGGQIRGMAPLGSPVTIDLDDKGRGRDRIPLAPFGVDGSGGWVLVSLADATWTGSPETMIGQILPLGARVPTVLGDGYGSEKPVAVALDQQITNYISGTRFTVEYLGDDGSWHNVTQSVAESTASDASILTLRYQVPNGLLAKPYRFRAHNVSDPSAIDAEWVVTPSTTALPLERVSLLEVPELGTAVAGSAGTADYSTRKVVVVSSVLVGLGLVTVVLAPAITAHRRRVEMTP